MTFWELSRFIDRALQKLSDPSVHSNEELPNTQEELVALCNLLSKKGEELKAVAPQTERPTYEGPDPPGPFTPSYDLRSLYNKLERFERRVDDTYRNGSSQIVIEYVEDELKKVEQEVAPVEREEKEEHERRLAEYRDVRQPYWDRLQLWEAEEEKRQEAEAKIDRTVRRLSGQFKRAFTRKPTGYVPYELLPPGEATEDRVRGYYGDLHRRGKLPHFDQDRLDKMLALPWNDWRPGKAGKHLGYSIFTFSHTEKVLLECPIYANAIYILNSGEERLLRMNKQELIASGEAKRLFHVGNWYPKIKKELGISMSSEYSYE